MKKTLLIAIAVAGVFTLAASAQAGDAVMSPRAKQMADSLKTVPGTTSDMIDRSIQPGTPKSRELAYSLRKVPSTGPSIDLAHAPRPTMSPKDQRYEVALRENAAKQLEIQVAPLK
jgi:hypothetical protein